MATQTNGLQQDKQGKSPVETGRDEKDRARADPVKPVRVSREEAEKNIPPDHDPDDPVSQ